MCIILLYVQFIEEHNVNIIIVIIINFMYTLYPEKKQNYSRFNRTVLKLLVLQNKNTRYDNTNIQRIDIFNKIYFN